MSLKEKLNQEYTQCVCRNCVDEGCTIVLDKISKDHILISGKKYKKIYSYSDELCDFVLFDHATENPVRIALLELKGGRVDEREFKKAYDQLKNGAVVASNMAVSVDVVDFVPYLAHGGGMNAFAAKMLDNPKYKVRFRTSSKSIKTLHCGSSLPF
jgi:hypothetical protein